MTGLGDARDIIRGAIASFFGFGGRLIARALLMIVAGRAYGIEALGVLGQVAAITEIAAAIGVMGLKRGLLDMLSFDEKNSRQPATRILEALGVALGLSILISTALLLVWYAVLPDHVDLAPILFVAVPAIVFTDVSLTAIKHKRVIGWDVWSRGIAEPWCFLLFAVIFFQLAMIQNGLVIAYVGSIVVTALLAGCGLLRTYGFTALSRSKPKLSNCPAILRQSTPIGVTDMGVMALRRLDLIVLGMFVSAEGVGLYYMVQQLATVPQKTYALFEPMLSPVIARLHNKVNTKQIRANLIAVCRWVFIIQLAISIPMAVFGGEVLSIFGPGFSIGVVALAIVLLAELIDGSFLALETPLVFTKPKLPPVLIFLALLVEVVMIALLSSIWGVDGAATGFLIAIIFLAAGRLFMAKKHLDISVLNVSYAAPMILAVAVFKVLFFAQRWAPPQHGAFVVFSFVAGITLYLSLIYRFALTGSDRMLFRALARQRQRRRPRPAPL